MMMSPRLGSLTENLSLDLFWKVPEKSENVWQAPAQPTIKQAGKKKTHKIWAKELAHIGQSDLAWQPD